MTQTSTIRFKEKMIHLEKKTFLMGTNDKKGFLKDHEGPTREVKVDSFFIDSYCVTNEEFAQFVKETGYRTESEKYGWSFVFYKLLTQEELAESQQVEGTPWWNAVPGACWNHPEGLHSSIENRLDHPVIHVTWNDAIAFCEWAGKRLPTEIEWEYAARGGLVQKQYAWGDELHPDGKHMCNIWQGEFPITNTEEDGYLATAPAKSFPPNGFGLYNVAGNVWEWCSNWFVFLDKEENIVEEINNQTPKSMRGGSYLCHPSYCNRYRVAARTGNTMESSAGNIGFRCVADN